MKNKINSLQTLKLNNLQPILAHISATLFINNNLINIWIYFNGLKELLSILLTNNSLQISFEFLK